MIFAANFKTNHTRTSTNIYIEELTQFLKENQITDDSIYVFPPATALRNSSSNVKVGAQNVWSAQNGSFTGEIGIEQLDEFDIKTVLIGHSERRHILKESLAVVKEKFNFYKKNDYEIFFCIGEPLEIKEQGIESVMDYIADQINGIDLNYEKLIVAYEPVWAIGTGVTATSSDIETIHNRIKEFCSRPLLYGGSVKTNNVKEILNINSVDGVLVGTSSWDIEDFKKLIK